MGNTYDFYKTDNDLENNGAWVTLTDGSRWKLRRAGCDIGRKAYNKASGPHKSVIAAANSRGKQLPIHIDREIARNTIVNGLVVAWEGVSDENGDDLPFTIANAIKLLTDLPDLASEILAAASEMDNFKTAQDDEAAKNSEAG